MARKSSADLVSAFSFRFDSASVNSKLEVERNSRRPRTSSSFATRGGGGEVSVVPATARNFATSPHAIDEMSLASGVSRVKHPDAPLSARDVLALATCDGAAALGMGDRIGSIEVGKQADLIMIDASGVHMAPFAADDAYVAVVEAARPSDVRLTMVAGRVLFQSGAWSTLDAGRVTAEARTEGTQLMQRVEAA